FPDAPPGPNGPPEAGFTAAGSFTVGSSGVLLGPSWAVVMDNPRSRVVRVSARPGRWHVYWTPERLLLRHTDPPTWRARLQALAFAQKDAIEAPYGAIGVLDGARA